MCRDLGPNDENRDLTEGREQEVRCDMCQRCEALTEENAILREVAERASDVCLGVRDLPWAHSQGGIKKLREELERATEAWKAWQKKKGVSVLADKEVKS